MTDTKFQRVAPPSEADLDRRLRSIEAELRSIRSARRLEAATIGKGGLTVQEPGDIRIVDDGGNVVFSATDGPIRTTSKAGGTDNTTLTANGQWQTAPGFADVPIEPGFSTLLLTVTASVGATVNGGSGSGWLAVLAQAYFVDAAGATLTYTGTQYGIAPNMYIPFNAPGGPVSGLSVANLVMSGGIPAGAVALRCSAQYALSQPGGSTQPGGSGNAHVFGSLIHTR